MLVVGDHGALGLVSLPCRVLGERPTGGSDFWRWRQDCMFYVLRLRHGIACRRCLARMGIRLAACVLESLGSFSCRFAE